MNALDHLPGSVRPMICPRCEEFRARAVKAEAALRAATKQDQLDPALVAAALGLSPQQARVLAMLASAPGFVTSETLLGDASRGPSLLRVILHAIRSRAPWATIMSVRGVGYVLTPETRAEVFRLVREFECGGESVAPRRAAVPERRAGRRAQGG